MTSSPIAVLAHVTLDTGDVFLSPRSAARERAVALLRARLAGAPLSSGRLVPVPCRSDYAYLATVERAGLLVTLVRVSPHGPAPVVTFGVAVDDSYADLWALLHRRHSSLRGLVPCTEPGDPPQPPWLAVRLEPAAPSIPPADLLWLADFERTLAWAWIDHVGERRSEATA